MLKAWLQHTGTPAAVRYYGCPAEETCEGKVFMARAGAFDDLDMALTWHPGSTNTVWAGSSLAVNNITYRFRGRTAHAAAIASGTPIAMPGMTTIRASRTIILLTSPRVAPMLMRTPISRTRDDTE